MTALATRGVVYRIQIYRKTYAILFMIRKLFLKKSFGFNFKLLHDVMNHHASF